MNALIAAGSRTSLASSRPASTWLRMIDALVSGFSWSCGLRPRGWFSTKVLRLRELPDVVVVRSDAGEQRVRADRAASRVGEIRQRDRVRVGARRLEAEPLEQRMVEVAPLEQREVRLAAR
jgi:hypothetical protein